MQPESRTLLVVLLCAGALAARLIVGAHITDDAYITMRYSRNLSAAGSMSYNPPDAVLGTSSPLWTAVLAGGIAVGASPQSTAMVVACLADLISIVVLLTSPVGTSMAAIAAAAAIAAWPAYIVYAVSGMETSFYVAGIVWFVTAASRNWVFASAIAASLASLARPDGALLVVLGIAWAWRVKGKAAAFRFGLAAAMLCGPWIAYAFIRFGSVIPASVLAKSSANDPWTMSFENLSGYFFTGIYVPLTVLALIGFLWVVKTAGVFWRLWSVWAWTYTAAMTAANAFTHFPWYFVPLLPIYLAAAALGVERLISRASWLTRLADAPAARPLFAAVMVGVLLTRMTPLRSYLDAAASGRETLYASVAAELAAIDPRCTVAATEIGTVGYYYPGRVLDLVGLVSPEVVGLPVDAVLAGSNARWVVSYDTHFDRSAATSDRFTTVFARRSSTPVGPARSLEIYERRNPAACR